MKQITLSHGSGGEETHELIENLFYKYFNNDILLQQNDSSIIDEINGKLVVTTDSFVINPIFFNGGDIGKLSVCGTVNDLCMSGATPLYITVAFIIEEGFLVEDLEKILPEFIENKCTSLLEIRVKCGARVDLGRPKEKPQENKKLFMANLNQVDFCYRGAIENLSEIVKFENTKKVLIFTGKKSYENIKNIIEDSLQGVDIQYYNDFSINPKDEEIKIAIDKIDDNYDMIIAVGGGSVIDFAKTYKWQVKSNKKLVAIPTTAGTGSEATQFAVLYVNGVKTSIDDVSILPNYAIIDSQFVENCPKDVRLSCALDSFCQSLESYWAVNSTAVSREFAKESLLLTKECMVSYINNPNSENSQKMSLASNLAGKAINLSRTTASHALSYKITSDYNVPHGKAVALTIKNLFRNNENVNEINCNDKRGIDFVRSRMGELKDILEIENSQTFFENLFVQINFDDNLSHYGIVDFNAILKNVNKERLKNNPVDLELNFIKK